jgi:hypothetical protein
MSPAEPRAGALPPHRRLLPRPPVRALRTRQRLAQRPQPSLRGVEMLRVGNEFAGGQRCEVLDADVRPDDRLRPGWRLGVFDLSSL